MYATNELFETKKNAANEAFKHAVKTFDDVGFVVFETRVMKAVELYD